MNQIETLYKLCKKHGGFYLMRHGQTDWNVKKIYMGSKDIPLNERGREQAREAIEKIRPLRIKVIFSSDLSRASETAEIISKELNLHVIKSNLLRESHGGITEGKSYCDGSEDEKLFTDAWYGKIIPDGGENWHDTATRAISFIISSMEKFESPLLFVSHGGVHRAVGEAITGDIPDVPNCHIEYIVTAIFRDLN